ncbi:hypothetical protein ACN27G_13685 [Plantactinospora sp. WMMB334]|uniref:hypothetical protein n=1 Tax=Plantactinospora sp. WMMB334 TaxID=3404119 RepID=UPI003B92CDB7
MNSDVRQAASTSRSVHEAFVELVQHDDDLMRAEFEALIDACWHEPPPPPPARPQPAPRPPLWPVGPPDGERFVAVQSTLTGCRWRRQRGPPAGGGTHAPAQEGR